MRGRSSTFRSAVGLTLGLGLALPVASPFRLFSTPARAQPPSPGLFGKEPTTPLELWDAADFLVRTGQAEQAEPYLKKFAGSNPDDATLLKIRDQYGTKSILRLQDHPETRPFAEPLVKQLGEATRRNATNPERVARFIGELTKTREEQDYAVERLREAGPYAVPPLVRELNQPALPAGDRALIVRNMGRLDASAVPPLLATLEGASTHARLASDAAEVLGAIGDPRAVPGLTALAATADPASPARDAAARAVGRITGTPFDSQPRSPSKVLADEARRYHLHKLRFPGDQVTLWSWDEAQEVPVSRVVPRTEAEGLLGTDYARAALAIDPSDRAAQALIVGIGLEKAVERAGFPAYPKDDPSGAFPAALAAGPDVLGDVLRGALDAGKTDLAAVAADALGRVTDANALPERGMANPLVEALSSPGRRVRFAAARALVGLDPRCPFAGSSRVVPVLAQFAANRQVARALVIDGNPGRGGRLAGQLKALGFEPVVAPTGDEGFRVAAESADVELILADHHMIQGPWRLHDTLANLRADARTAGIPVYVVGPLGREPDLASVGVRFPGVRFLVTPDSPETLKQELSIAGFPEPLSAGERSGYAREASALLGAIGSRPNSTYTADLGRVEPALTAALNTPGNGAGVLPALGDVPDANAQRSLADVALDPSKAAGLRLAASSQLARSVQAFGPLVSADQEAKLLAAFDAEPDPALRGAFGAVVGALRPEPAQAGVRLRAVRPAPVAPPTNDAPAPDAAPAPAAAPAPGQV